MAPTSNDDNKLTHDKYLDGVLQASRLESRRRFLILYASQTGNALDVAERVGREAERMGFPAVVLSMDDFNASFLPYEKIVIIIASTTGQGDIPDSMKVFWRFLLKRNISSSWLKGVHYAVFGLGDSGYQKFNLAAKKLNKRLSNLGAEQMIEIGLGDDQHPSGYEGALDPWLFSLWSFFTDPGQKETPLWRFLSQINPTISLRSTIDPATETLDRPKFQVIYHDADEIQTESASASDLEYIKGQIERCRLMSAGKIGSSKLRPDSFLQMKKNQPLTRTGCGKDVHHFEFEPVLSDVRYQVGDVLEILPSQNPSAVEAFIQRCNLNPEIYITVIENGISNMPTNVSRRPVKLQTFVELTMDVASASPRRYFFEVMRFFATAEIEKEKLQHFASPEGRDDLYQYNQRERRSVLEVLEDFPSVQLPFEWLVQLVPPLKPRAFSISSSPLAHPNQVHLTVSVVSWTTPYKRKRSGLCSTWLAGLNPEQGVYIPVWFNKGLLPSPSPSLPLILIGPGTGCAPFRGFIAERAAQSSSRPTAPILFFFGCRNKENDFLYNDFWETHAENGGVLSEEKGGGFSVAFSRDQLKKVYVQDKMEEESGRVWNLLSSGAAVYIAGSASKMPADVMSAFEKIVAKEGGVSLDLAEKWLRDLEKAGKYNVEAWS
ncbi:multidrug-resistance type transporter [Ranunculus cassubicifolius]